MKRSICRMQDLIKCIYGQFRVLEARLDQKAKKENLEYQVPLDLEELLDQKVQREILELLGFPEPQVSKDWVESKVSLENLVMMEKKEILGHQETQGLEGILACKEQVENR